MTSDIMNGFLYLQNFYCWYFKYYCVYCLILKCLKHISPCSNFDNLPKCLCILCVLYFFMHISQESFNLYVAKYFLVIQTCLLHNLCGLVTTNISSSLTEFSHTYNIKTHKAITLHSIHYVMHKLRRVIALCFRDTKQIRVQMMSWPDRRVKRAKFLLTEQVYSTRVLEYISLWIIIKIIIAYIGKNKMYIHYTLTQTY